MSEEEETEKPKRPRAAKSAATARADASAAAADSAPAGDAASEKTEAEKPKRARKPAAAKAKASDEAKPTKTPRTAKAKDEAVSAAAAPTSKSKSADEPAKEPARATKAKSTEKAASKSKRSTDHESPSDVKVVRAQAKYVRSSARKARLVCDNIRGKSVTDARAILAHTPRAIARDWSKLLESAVANAEHNHELVGEDLVIKAVTADEGPTIKRFRPRARGRAASIRKRTSHLTILLTPKN